MNERILKFAESKQYLGKIARSGENNTRSLAFDCSAALEDYPTAQIIAVIQRPRGDPYTITPDADGTIRRITLTGYDLEFNGHLQVELRVIDGDKILKSAIYTATVDDSIRGEADAPGQPVRDVLDRLDTEIKQAQAVVDDIRQKLENGEFNGSDAEVTAENIEAALGYVPGKTLAPENYDGQIENLFPDKITFIINNFWRYGKVCQFVLQFNVLETMKVDYGANIAKLPFVSAMRCWLNNALDFFIDPNGVYIRLNDENIYRGNLILSGMYITNDTATAAAEVTALASDDASFPVEAKVNKVQAKTDTLENTTDDIVLMMADIIGGGE